MAFIIDKIRERIETEDNSENGFSDMNYIIGESSAMDIGEFPTPMDERIGFAAMTGGELMELQITNPATFTLERDSMISTIDQLGLDITLHPDMNAGFASAQKTGQGEQYGYETVEQYFTEYIQELAAFKHHVENNSHADFDIGRMNPHISTTPMPPLEERMETDVGVDPFGFVTNTYDEENRKQRNHRGQNIYKNPEFLRKLYYTLFLEVSNYPFQNYGQFAAYSDEFNREWGKAQHEAAWEIFNADNWSLDEKLSAVMTTRQRDQGINRKWLEVLDSEIKVEPGFPSVQPELEHDEDDNPSLEGIDIERENDLGSIIQELGDRDTIRLQTLDNILYAVDKMTEERFLSRIDEIAAQIDDEEEIRRAKNKIREQINVGEIKDAIRSAIETGLNELWHEEGADPQEQKISQDAKWNALQSALDVQQIRIFELAYEIGKEKHNIEELAADVFSGKDKENYFNPEPRENFESEEEMHEDLLERILTGQQFQRELWKESTLFYQVIPAWMSSADNYVENEEGQVVHEGWEAPEFIWDALVVSKWEDRKDLDVNLRLTEPRNGVYDQEGDDEVYHFLDLLEDSREFRMDVAAAVGACYVWAHFTQRRVQFNLRSHEFGLDEKEGSGTYTEMSEKQEVSREGWTWIDWMNRFGLGVNLETMQGSPQQKFKIWRPKDIAVASHAVNLTARKRAENGGLGGLDEVNEELDGRPAKFTIDMEHTATMGAPPMHEMKVFKEQEEELAENWSELGIDKDKPVAKILRQIHLMDPGVEGQRGTYHGAIERGNTQLYEWLYKFVDWGFARNPEEAATILFELAEHQAESVYVMKIMMDMIELGVAPEDDLDPARVDPGEEPESEEEALIARFFGMERENYEREWAKVEEHAFDPLKGLLEAEDFDYTYSGRAATDNENRPQEWQSEEYR